MAIGYWLLANLLNEFRQDLVSGEWVLFATGRAKKPVSEPEKENGAYQSKEKCPFEDIYGSKQEILWLYPDKKDKWEIAVIKNKYPAIEPGVCQPGSKSGPFSTYPAVGHHDVIVYRDHDKHFADFSTDQLAAVVGVYKKRYKEIFKESGECLQYVMIFHNFGFQAGASLHHPHSQIISMPILPPDVARSLNGSFGFFKQSGQKVYDLIVQWEKEQEKRIIYEND